jgi:hypothetical protein
MFQILSQTLPLLFLLNKSIGSNIGANLYVSASVPSTSQITALEMPHPTAIYSQVPTTQGENVLAQPAIVYSKNL